MSIVASWTLLIAGVLVAGFAWRKWPSGKGWGTLSGASLIATGTYLIFEKAASDFKYPALIVLGVLMLVGFIGFSRSAWRSVRVELALAAMAAGAIGASSFWTRAPAAIRAGMPIVGGVLAAAFLALMLARVARLALSAPRRR